jgi:hypothetical protein
VITEDLGYSKQANQKMLQAGKPLVNVETAIELIGSTTTKTGLKVICQRDDNVYELAIAVSDEDFESINIVKIEPFDSWNCIIKPLHFRKLLLYSS